MQKNKQILEKDLDLKYKILSLDKNKIHILYFSYYLNLHNVYHSPLLLTTKILNFLKRDKQIDHICHISRFVFDEESNFYEPKIFEANTLRGMEQNDLIDRLQAFQGICYIETIDKEVDKVAAKEFEKEFYGVQYSKFNAALSGLDGFFNRIKPKNNGGFCSWLVALFLKTQNIDLGNEKELTPVNIFNKKLGNLCILYKA